jgi:hypothetical protein
MKSFVITEKKLNALRLELSPSIIKNLMEYTLEEELLKKKNLNVGHIYAFESGLEEGKRQEREKILNVWIDWMDANKNFLFPGGRHAAEIIIESSRGGK